MALTIVEFAMIIGGLLWAYFKVIAGLDKRLSKVEDKCIDNRELIIENKKLGDRVNKVEDEIIAQRTKMDMMWAPMEKDKTITLEELEELKVMLEKIVSDDKSKNEVFASILMIGRLNQLIFDANRMAALGRGYYGC